MADSEFASSLLGYQTPLSLRDFLEAVSRGFVCPITDAPLCPGGAELELTVSTLQEYVRLVSRLWLADGVARQAAAFRAGIADFVQAPDVLLAPFSLAAGWNRRRTSLDKTTPPQTPLGLRARVPLWQNPTMAHGPFSALFKKHSLQGGWALWRHERRLPAPFRVGWQ